MEKWCLSGGSWRFCGSCEAMKGDRVDKLTEYAGAAALVLILAACDVKPGDAGGASSAAEGASAAAADGPLEVTAAELSEAFQGNEAKAKLAYDGKPLKVTGVVKDITLDFMDSPQIKLRGSGEVQGMGISKGGKMTDVTIGGLSKEQAATIEKGQKFTAVCQKVDEVLGGPVLTGCEI